MKKYWENIYEKTGRERERESVLFSFMLAYSHLYKLKKKRYKKIRFVRLPRKDFANCELITEDTNKLKRESLMTAEARR